MSVRQSCEIMPAKIIQMLARSSMQTRTLTHRIVLAALIAAAALSVRPALADPPAAPRSSPDFDYRLAESSANGSPHYAVPSVTGTPPTFYGPVSPFDAGLCCWPGPVCVDGHRHAMPFGGC